ncbi:MAG: LuxR C-terminal-related transcriptional regulator, partial [Chloroflexota bacterium]
RSVPMLATHLTFRQIGARLFISENTVKTQAMSTYRKPDTTPRIEAVNHAVDAGLLEPAAVSAVVTTGTRA